MCFLHCADDGCCLHRRVRELRHELLRSICLAPFVDIDGPNARSPYVPTDCKEKYTADIALPDDCNIWLLDVILQNLSAEVIDFCRLVAL